MNTLTFVDKLYFLSEILFILQVDENEMRDFFARYGSVKEVKIITYRGGICKGWVLLCWNAGVPTVMSAFYYNDLHFYSSCF